MSWVKGHADDIGHEGADKLAKLGANDERFMVEDALLVSAKFYYIKILPQPQIFQGGSWDFRGWVKKILDRGNKK